jgi:hypothetical protein
MVHELLGIKSNIVSLKNVPAISKELEEESSSSESEEEKPEELDEYEIEFRKEVEKLKAKIAQHTTSTLKCVVSDCLRPKIAHTTHYLKIIDNFNQENRGELTYIINIIWLNFQDIVLILKRKEDDLPKKGKGKLSKKKELEQFVFRDVTEIYGRYSIDPDFDIYGIAFNRNKDLDD